MELRISVPEFHWDEGSALGVKKVFVESVLKDIEPIGSQVEVKQANWPVGGDLLFIDFVLSNSIIKGKEINEAVDSWMGLAKKFVGVLSVIRENRGTILVCRDAAKLIALDYLRKQVDIKYIEEIAGQTLKVETFEASSEKGLAESPLGLYVLFFKINNENVYVFGIKSTGDIEFTYTLDTKKPYSFIFGENINV